MTSALIEEPVLPTSGAETCGGARPPQRNGRGGGPGRRAVDFSGSANEDVIRWAAKGNEPAWREVVKRFGPMVERVAQGRGLNAADAADVQQATWIQLLRNADQVREPERIGGWLATTARRESLRLATASSRRTGSAMPIEDLAPTAVSTEDVESDSLRYELEPCLEQALDRLPPQYRLLIQLLTSDLAPSYSDVAQAMDLPIGSIGPMRLRGLQMLRLDPGLRGHPGLGQ